jgi:processive 1,2-diacylglycerol beta-glucosyltransferase
MKKVLILTAGFGEGHNAAARNLRDALEIVSEEVKVEVLDLFESSYGKFNTLARKTYLGMVQYAPSVWGGIYSLLDNSKMVENRLGSFTRLKNALSDILHETQPDVVVSTYPVYAHVIKDLYRNYAERPFRFLTVVTDSITINSAWFRAPSDLYCVPNEATADVMHKAGVPRSQLEVSGFPVSHLFTEKPTLPLHTPAGDEMRKILYIISTGKKKAGKVIDRLLEIPKTELTITCGRDAELKDTLIERTRKQKDRVHILGWTNQMPQLMLSHHMVISKAGGATVQEAIAARCPMIVNQVIPGQEEGNARLIADYKLGAVAERNREVPELVAEAFKHKAMQWQEWRRNLTKISKPDASFRLAKLVLAECEHTDPARKKVKLFEAPMMPTREPVTVEAGGPARSLLCDFHIHTTYSDGKLSVPEVVDFYGQFGFDCICITDHLADPRRIIGKLARLSRLVISEDQLDEYFEVIERERRRAWRKYGMIVMAGMEFNKDGLTEKTSAHLLGVGIKSPIPSALDLPETIAHIHAQGGLAVASHPHIMKSEWGKNTLYLWENHEKFAPLIDAWEIANRHNIFDCVGMKRLPFLANSDFHKPKHIYSWKTLLHCEKNEEAIKECVRKNEHVSITLFRENNPVVRAEVPEPTRSERDLIHLPSETPLVAAKMLS